jgi:acetyltransferase-like isoleucine patch superfamily enzyme
LLHCKIWVWRKYLVIRGVLESKVCHCKNEFNFSDDLVKGGTAPFDPSMNIDNDQTYSKKGTIWREKDVKLGKSVELKNVVLGAGSVIGDGATITNSSIGRKSVVPAGVFVQDSIIWDNVILNQGCKIYRSIIATDNVLSNDTRLGLGTVLPPKTNLPADTAISDNQTFTIYTSTGQPFLNPADADAKQSEEIPIGMSIYMSILINSLVKPH